MSHTTVNIEDVSPGDTVVVDGERKVVRFLTGDPICARTDLHFGPLDTFSAQRGTQVEVERMVMVRATPENAPHVYAILHGKAAK